MDGAKKWREQNAAIMQAAPAEALPAPEVAAHAPTEPLAPHELPPHELPIDPHSASAQHPPKAEA
jgi:sec-independent protein translocase protein TatB